MKALVFYNGSTGSIGQFLKSEALDHNVTAIALRSRLENSDHLKDELEQHLNSMKDIPEIITLINLAAVVSVPFCEANSDHTYWINVKATSDSIRAFTETASKFKKKSRVVYISTGHVYAPSKEGALIKEDNKVAPRSVYAKSKLAAEESLRNLRKSCDFSLIIARVFGVIAPNQPENYILPGLITRLNTNAAQIPGLEYTRDYLDARDICDALIKLAINKDIPSFEILNLCGSQPIRIRDLANKILRLQNRNVDLSTLPGRKDDIPWMVGSNAKCTAYLGSPIKKITTEKTIKDALVLLSS